MLPFLLAAALAGAQPSPCPTDLLVANPRLKVVRSRDNKKVDNYVITVAIKNTGTVPQRPTVKQHLDLLMGPTVVGTQPIPPIEGDDDYDAAFRLQLPHEKKRKPLTVTFHFVIDSKAAPGENCTTTNDKLTKTL